MATYPYGYDNCAACGEPWPEGQEVCGNCRARPGESDVDRSLRLAEEDAEPARYQIVLTFDSAEELQAALEYVGDEDAPVMIDEGSSVTVDGATYPLWDEYEQATAHLTTIMESEDRA
jgi:hypothetical protein